MNKIILSGLIILIVTLIACSGNADTEAEITTPTPYPTGTNTKSSASTDAQSPKVIQAPETSGLTTKFSDAPDRDLFRLTKILVPGARDIANTITGDAPNYAVGRTDTFWLVDLANTEIYQSDFELVLVTPHAYWYMEKDLSFSLSGLGLSAARFEEDIYPVVTRVFGSEWNPGIDNDPRLNILNAKLSNVAGYYSSTDEYPIGVQEKSNQREIIYMNALNVPPGGANYDQVLAHELQHAIHWYADASEDTWINEGLAELSSSIALGSTFSIGRFLRGQPISLVHWPTSSVGDIANYGAASLFMHYLTEHSGDREDLKTLLEQPEDGIAGIDKYLESMGFESRFVDIFQEWSVANILDDEGKLGYKDLDVHSTVSGRLSGFDQASSDIPQFAVEYTELTSNTEPFSLSFQGSTITPLLPVDVGENGCWWSNSGDSIDSTLTHQVRIHEASAATLEYEIWFEVEKDWDYIYLEVSVDQGQTWQIIKTPASSTENPFGNSFGPGYSGTSRGWVKESINLSAYQGENTMVRFQYITDDAVNASGGCVRDLSISVDGVDQADSEWVANGFILTKNLVRQDFQVQLITKGDDPQVRQVILNSDNFGKITVQPPGEDEQLILAVGSLADKTRQPASYSITVAPVK